jgi:hypothetical protein
VCVHFEYYLQCIFLVEVTYKNIKKFNNVFYLPLQHVALAGFFFFPKRTFWGEEEKKIQNFKFPKQPSLVLAKCVNKTGKSHFDVIYTVVIFLLCSRYFPKMCCAIAIGADEFSAVDPLSSLSHPLSLFVCI